EKVYFTLQEELIKPQAQAVYRPSESINTLVREPVLAADKQQIAQVLLTSVKPKVPARWQVAPVLERRQKVEGQIQQVGWALWNHCWNSPSFMEYDKTAKRWSFKPGLLEDIVKANQLNAAMLNDPFGSKWTLDDVARLEKNFDVEHLARGVTLMHMQQVFGAFINYTNANQAKWLKDGKWTLPESVLLDAAK